jgi:hypothetical protein
MSMAREHDHLAIAGKAKKLRTKLSANGSKLKARMKKGG